MAVLPNTPNNRTENVKIVAEIFAEYGDFIYSTICYKVKDEAQADDLYQDFFLSLVSKPPSPNVQDMKSYLYRAINNDIFDAYRRIARFKTLMKKYAKYSKFAINKEAPKNAFVNEEQVNEIFSIIGEQLSASERKALTLRYGEGCSIKQIAEKMVLKRGSVTRYICIGLKKIRQLLKAKEGK